jgi:hypothetical protein
MAEPQRDPDERLSWIVACLGSGVETKHDITEVRPLTDAEAAEALRANSLVHSVTTARSPYGKFEARLDAFEQGVSDAIASMESGPLQRPDPPLDQRFSDVLHAFKVFLDHTPHRLRKAFGKSSPAETAFREACGAEYDHAFEYRLAYNLRNEAEHRTDVLSVNYAKSIGTPARVRAVIANDVIENAIRDTKWQARVRRELKDRVGPIGAPDLLVVLRGCVQRIYFRTLLAQRREIEEAIATSERLAQDVDCAGELALVGYGPPDPEILGAQFSLKIQRLGIEAAALISAALPDGERLLWPRFAIQVSDEWLVPAASEAVLRALEGDPTVHSTVLSMVEEKCFIGVTSLTGYAARTAIARAIVRSNVEVADHRTGPPIPLR